MPFKPFKNQAFEELKSQCLNSGQLFQDNLFPPDNSSLNRKTPSNNQVFWKRPSEIIINPQFIVNGINPNDLSQGSVGDCWFISAAASIANFSQYFQRVIPSNQSFDTNYAGIFNFRFWVFGEWVSIVVDDYLPTDESGELIYCKNSKEKNEFFGPLLEKAYAKLYGCYEFIDGGNPADALTDLTGAISEYFDLRKCAQLTYDSSNSDEVDEETEVGDEASDDANEDNSTISTDLETLWQFILKSNQMKVLMNASFGCLDANNKETEKDNGLFGGHAYSVIQIVEIPLVFKNKKKSNTRLLKLRNPWGSENPWNGQWSIRSNSWNKLNKNIKAKYNLSLTNSGDFYISFDDFIKNFEELIVSHINMESYFDPNEDSSHDRQDWTDDKYFGEWIPGASHEDDGLNCTQYLIKNSNTNKDSAPVIISLLQSIDLGRGSGKSYYYIKYNVYSIKTDASLIERKISSGIKFTEDELELYSSTGKYDCIRDLSRRETIESGYYLVVPFVTELTSNVKYLMRIFHDNHSVQVFQV